MSTQLLVYFKPSCSKCRTFVQAMQTEGITCEYIEYLNFPLDENGLTAILEKLGKRAFELVRTSEDLYKNKYSGKSRSDKQWIKILVKNPILLQRPIVVQGDNAWLARDEKTIEEVIKNTNRKQPK